MGIIASKGTPLLNLCKERKELIRGARDARYHLARSHLLYFKSLLDFSNALNQFVHQDLIVIPYSSDDDSSSDLVCSDSGSDSDTDCLVCDQSQTAPLSNKDDNQNPQKPACGDGTCGSSKGMEKSKDGLGFKEKEFVTAPIEDEMRGSQNPSFVQQNTFMGKDIFGLFDPVYNTQCTFIEPEPNQRDEVESDGYREIREREGIPDLESDSDHNSLIRKNQKKKKKKKKKKKSVKESSSGSSDRDKRDVEAKTCNGQVSDEVDNSNETCEKETEQTPEIVIEEVTISDEEVCDEGNESSSSSESSCSGLSDLRNVVKKISCICEKAVSNNSEVSELLEVNRVVHQQPLGSPFKVFASRVLGSPGNPVRRTLLLRRGLREDDIPGSLSMTLQKLYMWEKKLYEEVTVEEKLRVSYEKEYKILRDLDQNGGEQDKIHEVRAMVKHQSSKVNVSVRTIESVSMRIHKIRDEELFFEVIKIINGFKEMWRFLAKCHHKQFLAAGRSKSCVHIVEKGSSSRKATKQVEDKIRSYRDSLRGYIDAERCFVKLLNEWVNRNIMEEDETEIEAPQIFKVCTEWLREIESVDEIKVLSAVEEMRLRFRGLGLKQVEEKKQRIRTERLSKELEKKTKEVEEIFGTADVFPASDSDPAGLELLFLRESVTQEREKHERVIRELNDAVSMCLLESLVPIFEGLKDFCFDNFKAYQNIGIVSTETL